MGIIDFSHFTIWHIVIIIALVIGWFVVMGMRR